MTKLEKSLFVMLIDIFENEITDQEYDEYMQRLAELHEHRKQT